VLNGMNRCHSVSVKLYCKKAAFLLNAAFAMAILDFISHVHLPCRVVIPYRRFETTYRSHLQGFRNLDFLPEERISRNVGLVSWVVKYCLLQCMANLMWF